MTPLNLLSLRKEGLWQIYSGEMKRKKKKKKRIGRHFAKFYVLRVTQVSSRQNQIMNAFLLRVEMNIYILINYISSSLETGRIFSRKIWLKDELF